MSSSMPPPPMWKDVDNGPMGRYEGLKGFFLVLYLWVPPFLVAIVFWSMSEKYAMGSGKPPRRSPRGLMPLLATSFKDIWCHSQLCKCFIHLLLCLLPSIRLLACFYFVYTNLIALCKRISGCCGRASDYVDLDAFDEFEEDMEEEFDV